MVPKAASDRLGTVGNTELAEQSPGMSFDGGLTEEQGFAHLDVREPLTHAPQHQHLAAGETYFPLIDRSARPSCGQGGGRVPADRGNHL